MWGRNVCLYLKYLFESYITDVTLADEDTNSILTDSDNANRAIQGIVVMQVIW